ncbi:hypothetical protein AGMMS49992_03930 [Clostridia bacterium]|nr:hypothetical protein AGMMS49992_03930 [Clostridia bacterium]
MRQRIAAALLMILLLMGLYPIGVVGESAPTDAGSPSPIYRALLIACDEYVTYPNTAPTSHNNLLAMESLLENDTRSFAIRVQDGITQSAEALAAAIRYAFKDAAESDVSYLYISAHGSFNSDVADAESPEGELILSDGMEEARVSATALQSMLDPIPGIKLLIVDACNSGALIGKGISPNDEPDRLPELFSSDNYKALVSSGGSEPSWYWLSDSEGPPLGSSYFTTALAEGAGYRGEYAADRNRDGSITLEELYQYLRVSYAAATAQVKPLEDDFVVFQYDLMEDAKPDAPLSGFVFDRTTLDASSPRIHFSFTVSEPTRVGYQLVFMRDGVWNWQDAQVWLDTDDDSVTEHGLVSPGRKQRSLSLTNVSESDWGYALLNIIRYESGQPIVCASRVISVQPLTGEPHLSVALPTQATDEYDPTGPPLTVWVGHSFPCTLTVTVKQLSTDRTVRWLSVNQPTRPQGLSPNGSLFYWDGMDQNGARVEPGDYLITAAARVGQKGYSASYKISIVNTDEKP